MAKLHFFYSVMNAGKSTHLLQAAHNYESKGWNVIYFTSAIDNRSGVGYISSRVGISKEAIALTSENKSGSFYLHIPSYNPDTPCVFFVDEIQFFSDWQIEQLSEIVYEYKIPVLCYGLKNNSNGELFGPAIIKLLAKADSIRELKTVCHCGAKATQIVRRQNGIPILTSEKDVVQVGDTEFESVCHFHWKEEHYGK